MKHDATQHHTEARNVIRLTDDQVISMRELQDWIRIAVRYETTRALSKGRPVHSDELNQLMRFQTLLEEMLKNE